MAKKEFTEGPIYVAMTYFSWFVISNIYFLLLNILLIFFLLAIEVDLSNPTYYLMLFVAALPVAPSFTALLSVMGKLVREGDINLTKDYFKAYKENFRQAFSIGALFTVLIVLLLVDIRIIKASSLATFLLPIFYGCIFSILLIALYAFPIVSRFYLKTKDVLKLSAFYIIKRFKNTLLNIAGVAVVFIVAEYAPSIAFMLFASIIAYIIMFNGKGILEEIEEKIISNE
ncbi:MAG: DUF624 domain-containing protein [Clostridia bacterium]|jgi:uncharacterized membrane protein YesL|nr:DUF624 domain-containing protein [Clostridia bacterium]